MAEAEKNFTDRLTDKIWDLFASIKLAIILFALIALSSIVGTVLEQGGGVVGNNMDILIKLFGYRLAPKLYRAFEAMGFLDMYHSWWFIAFLLLFACNLLICSIDRFPRIWKLVRMPIKPITGDTMGGVPIKREVMLKGKAGTVRENVRSAFGFKFTELQEAGGYQFYAEKGRTSRLGVYITHFSIILILLGAIAGIIFGFNGMINIPEGEAYSVALTQPRGQFIEQDTEDKQRIWDAMDEARGSVSGAALMLGISDKALRARMKWLGLQPLGFTVKVNDFDVSYYANSETPKEFSSHLTVYDGGKKVMEKSIQVNDPLKYKGITFYQSSYGLIPDTSGARFLLQARSAAGAIEDFNLAMGESFTIPGTGIVATLSEFSPSLRFDPNGKPFTYDKEKMSNPGVLLDIVHGTEKFSWWVIKRQKEQGVLPGGHYIDLLDVWGIQYTGLQARKDPGVWAVYLGCITMSLGLYIAFFMSHKKLWVRLQGADKGKTRVLVGASANKNRQALANHIDKVLTRLKEGGK